MSIAWDSLETFSFVLSFLHQEGFAEAEKALLSEFEARFPAESRSTSSKSQSPCTRGDSGAESAGGLGALGPAAAARAAARPDADNGAPSSSSHDVGPSTSSAGPTAGPSRPTGPVLPFAPAAMVYKTSRPAAHQFSSRHPPWDSDVDEYENMDDVGYVRRDVPGQQHFKETELEVADEEGGSERYFTHQPGAAVGYGSDEHEDDDEDEEYSDGGGSYSAEQRAAAAPSSGGQPLDQQITLKASPSAAADESWDWGPTEIKIAPPVSTPSRSVERDARSEEPRPVLSRVESLSSSFKDFELERMDDESGHSGRLLNMVSDNDTQQQAEADMIEFAPLSSENVVSREDLEAFTRGASTASSLDVLQGSNQTGSISDTSELVRFAPAINASGASSSNSMPIAVVTTRPCQDDSKEHGGGFSFPITPPSVVHHEPDSRIFKSWTSVRSSCNSEVIAASDDEDNGPESPSKSGLSHASSQQPDGDLPAALELLPTGGKREPSLDMSKAAAAAAAARCASETSGSGQAVSPPSSSSPVPGASGGGCPEAAPATAEPLPLLVDDELLPLVLPTSAGGASTEEAATEGQQAAAKSGSVKAYDIQLPSDELQPTEGGASSPAGPSVGGSALAAAARVQSGRGASSSAPAAPAAAGPPNAVGSTDAGGSDTPPAKSPKAKDQVKATSPRSGGGTATSSGGGAGNAATAAATVTAAPATAAAHAAGTRGNDEVVEVESPSGSGQFLGAAARRAAAVRQQGEQGSEADDEEEDDEDDEDDDEETEDEEGPSNPMQWTELGGYVDSHPEAASPSAPFSPAQVVPKYTVDENGVLMYQWDPEYVEKRYECFSLNIIHRRHRTGFEDSKDFPIRMNDLIAGRYQVMDFLGSAAFSRAVQALDIKTNTLVCLKIIKNNKDYFDQSLDEIKLLKFVNSLDPDDQFGLVRLYDFFYYKEHLFLVCELLRANLYEFQKYNKESGDEPYFTNARIQRIAASVLHSLAFMHSLGLIHSDLKPENILIKSYSRCEVKVIDLGSSCFITDHLSSYVQSRSYRAPEVILGLPYDQKVDVWSLGCILAELSSGFVLFQNDSLSTLLARLEGILGPIPEWMIRKGRYSNRFFTRSGHLFHKLELPGGGERFELLVPKRTCLRHRVPDADEGLLGFIAYLLEVDPHKRPTAAEALQHPWLKHQYPSLDA